MKFITEIDKIICLENDRQVGEIAFPEIKKGVFDINHTFVDDCMRGRGLASQLVCRAINEINRRGGEIKASCSYAQKYIEKNGIRPVITCHMVMSIDGKVTGEFLYSKKGKQVSETYYDVNRKLKGDAFVCGRVTMESSFTNEFKPDLSVFADTKVPDGDYIAMKHNYYAVSFDSCGKVGWRDNKIHDEDPGYDNCHIIEVLTEKTPKEMLAYYRKTGVSYIFAGKEKIDIKAALNKLYCIFGIKKLMLEGGSIINGAFLREKVIDELSLIVAPVVAAKNDKPLFMDSDINEFSLVSTENMSDGSIWIRYAK